MRANWVFAALLPAIGSAQELTVFKNGEAADADAVNANFEALSDQLEVIDTRLLRGFDGSLQSIAVDCKADSNALKGALGGVSANAMVSLIIDGSCSIGEISTNSGQTLTIAGNDAKEDKLVGDAAGSAVVSSRGKLTLQNITVVKPQLNSAGIYVSHGGSAFLYNVFVDAKHTIIDSDSSYCLRVEFGASAYVEGFTCYSQSEGIGVKGASAAWVRGAMTLETSDKAISAVDNSAVSADRVNFSITGVPAMFLSGGSSFTQQDSTQNNGYVINGDIEVKNGSVLSFDDSLNINHSGNVSAEDAVLMLKNFTTPYYSLVRSKGHIAADKTLSSLRIFARQSNLYSEEFPQNAEVELINSKLAYYQGLGLDVVAFPVRCSGRSVVETGENLGRTFLYPSPTNKCDIISSF